MDFEIVLYTLNLAMMADKNMALEAFSKELFLSDIRYGKYVQEVIHACYDEGAETTGEMIIMLRGVIQSEASKN